MPRLPLRFQRLEQRIAPAILLVTNTNDAGAGSLRQAILDANLTAAQDTILISAVGTVTLTSQIVISTDLTIVGPESGSFTVSGGGTTRHFDIDNLNTGTSINVTMSRISLVAGNAGVEDGGSMRVTDENVTLFDMNISGNQGERGGAINLADNGRLTIDRSTLSGNTATGGGGGAMYVNDGSVTIIRDSVISGNSTPFGNGGAAYIDIVATFRVERSQVSSNSAGGDGGGLFVFSGGDLTVLKSTVAFNVSGGIGGGIDASSAEFVLENSTVSGNTALRGAGVSFGGYYGGGKGDGKGGGNSAPASFRNSTIVNNVATGVNASGGGIYSDRLVTNIRNTIISGNTAFSNPDLDVADGVFDVAFSLILTPGTATIVNSGGNITGIAPILSPLQINGDTMLPTHALLADSRGLNEGDPNFVGPATDERGFPRVAGPRIDIGAHETEFGWVRGRVLFSDGNNPDGGLNNVFVWLDSNGNGSPDNDEASALTDTDGNYLIPDLPGDYDPYRALRAGLFELQAGPGQQTLVAGVVNNVTSWIDRPIAGLKAFNGSDVLPSGVGAAALDFRNALGALNPNVAGTQNGGLGRREINWDGVPDTFAAPNNLPANFFNANSPRGAVFVGQGTGFQVSADSSNPTNTPTLFDNLNNTNSNFFSTFSPQRLFTALGTTVYDVEFFVPGTTTRATVSAFGAVFVDAQNAVQSSLEFFDAAGNSLGVFLVPHSDRSQLRMRGEGAIPEDGLSFLGVQFTDNRRAAKVRITTGNAEIGADDNFRSHDVVVVDDFIYSEPQAISVAPPMVQPIGISAIGSGVGGDATVLVYDQSGARVASFRAFDGSFRGEVHVATADIDGDGVEDVITGAGLGGGPHVQVYNGAKLLNGVAERIVTPLGSFFAFTPEFRGGVNVAAGDVDGDGRADIVIGAGPGGGPHVIAFSGANATVLTSFFAYDEGFRGGVNVAAGDFNADGRSEIATGAGPSGGPHVRVLDIANKATLADFFAYDAGFRGGVYVGAGDVLQNGRADLITGAGAGGTPHVRVFDGATFQVARDFLAYEAAFHGGVRVGVVSRFGTPLIGLAAGPGGGPHIRIVDKDLNQIDSFYAFDTFFPGGVFIG